MYTAHIVIYILQHFCGIDVMLAECLRSNQDVNKMGLQLV